MSVQIPEINMRDFSDAEGCVGAVTYNGKRYRQVCLVNAFRGVGLEVPYTCDGPFWVKHNGNEMLAPFGLELVEVSLEALNAEGLFVLHHDYHFIGCTVRDNTIYIHDCIHDHPVTEVLQLGFLPVLQREIRVFQLFSSASGLPADPRIVKRRPRPTWVRLGCRHDMPAASTDDWERRVRHRLAGVSAVKSAEDNYYNFVNVCVDGGCLDAQAKPSTPDPHDVTLSKRVWEAQMKLWRHKLRCAFEKAMATESRVDDCVGGLGFDCFSDVFDIVIVWTQRVDQLGARTNSRRTLRPHVLVWPNNLLHSSVDALCGLI